MKTSVIYYSFLGSTQKYAAWLNQKVDSDLFKMKEVNGEKLKDYYTLIVMSGTYAGQMPLNRYLTKNWPYIKDKKIIAVAVGAGPANDNQSKQAYELIPSEIRQKIKYFRLLGKFFGMNKDKVLPENLDEVIGAIK